MSKARKEIITRCNNLASVKMIFDGVQYIGDSDLNKDFNISIVEIKCDSDTEWKEKINGLKLELKRRWLKDGSRKVFKIDIGKRY